LRDSERRIATMATIHEQLYGTDDMQSIEFAGHALKLSQRLLTSMAENPNISCAYDLSQVELNIHQAIPCALILNELLTNAFKYAYPKGREGEIRVHLSCRDGMVTLAVSDEGVGLPPDFELRQSKTLGLEIVQALAKQLEGDLEIVSDRGACFSVDFPLQSEEMAAEGMAHAQGR
jgi:two-component sensor histidine kinase